MRGSPHSSIARPTRITLAVLAGLFCTAIAAGQVENPIRGLSPLDAGPPAPDRPQQSALLNEQYSLRMLHVVETWPLQSGSTQIVVAVIDSGIDPTHPDLVDRIWTNPREINNGLDDDGNGFVDDLHGWDFVQADNDPLDEADHGTHVAGIIAAGGLYKDGVAGVANVMIMPLRVLNANRQGVDTNVARAIDYAVRMGAHVVNVSLGGEQPNTFLRQACERAEASGVVVVAAAGNQGEGTVLYPAAYDTVVSVAAIDENNLTPAFSNYGYGVKVSAPGVNILSTVMNGQYGYRSGTSMATALVTGVAALLKSQEPGASAARIREALTSSADDINLPGWDQQTGFGRVNAYRALEALPSLDGQDRPINVSAVAGDQQLAIAAQDLAAPTLPCGLGVAPFFGLCLAGLWGIGRKF